MTMQRKEFMLIDTRELRCMEQPLDLYLDLIEPPAVRFVKLRHNHERRIMGLSE